MAIIAIDCDDTLALTNLTICKWHNETYKTTLTIDDFHHFQYWRNKGWGDLTTTMKKVHEFNNSDAWLSIPVIPEAIKGAQELKRRGHTLIMITARMSSEAEKTRDWVERYFGRDTFKEIYFTSAFETRAAHESDGQDVERAKIVPGNEPGRLHYTSMPRPKSEVCKKVGAKLLVDDSLQNADDVYRNAGIPVALYGDWAWNKTELDPVAAKSPKSWQQRIEDGEEEHLGPAVLPEGIKRCLTWTDVLAFADTVV